MMILVSKSVLAIVVTVSMSMLVIQVVVSKSVLCIILLGMGVVSVSLTVAA